MTTMTGPEHYLEAERLINQGNRGGLDPTSFNAEAQVHATLAVAAATALTALSATFEPGDANTWKAWRSAIGKPALAATAATQPLAINVVFDGPPGPVSGRFVEVELDDRSGINVGKWIRTP